MQAAESPGEKNNSFEVQTSSDSLLIIIPHQHCGYSGDLSMYIGLYTLGLAQQLVYLFL
jgi:hypothetical protein